MNDNIILEKEALEVTKKSQVPPLIYQIPIKEGRKVLEKAQDSPVFKYPVEITKIRIMIDKETVNLYLIRRKDIKKYKHIIFYTHGAGFVFGSFHTHEKLTRELAFRTDSILAFPEYTRSPEAIFPKALNECFAILQQIPKLLKDYNLKYDNDLILAGDSVGGNLAIGLTFLSKKKNLSIQKLVLFYPVTDDNFNTESYLKFAKNYYLEREEMIWFFDNYLPDKSKRNNILVTPLKATLDELSNFPPTLIINGEVDVLRDEGEEFARKLRLANNLVTSIRINGTIHDFVMLNSLDKTKSTRVAMNIAIDFINQK